MTLRYALLATLLALGGPAAAQTAEDVVKGVYLPDRQLCAEARSGSLQTVIEAGNMILTPRGFEAIEFNCAFLQALKNPRMPAGWVVTSMCEEPGYAYPELFAFVERTPGELDVTALSEGQGGHALPDEGNGVAPDDGEVVPEANVAPSSPVPPSPSEDGGATNQDEEEAYGISGTWYRCDGVALP